MSTGLQIDVNTGAVQSGHTQFRNKLINGDFRIMQRGAPAANISGAGAKVYTFDRWWFSQNNTASNSVQQLTGAAVGLGEFQYAARLQRPLNSTNVESMYLGQALESQDSAPLKGQTLTVSFWLRGGANSSGTVWFGLFSGTGTDQDAAGAAGNNWTGQTYIVLNQSLTPPTTWKYYTFTGAAPANCNQLGVWFVKLNSGTAGAADYVDIAGVQLEKGPAATPFEFRPYTTELLSCQRYFARYGNNGIAPYCMIGTGMNINTTQAWICLNYPVPMRVPPSISVSSAGHFALTAIGAGGYTCTSIGLNAADSSGVLSARVDATIGSASLTANYCTLLRTNNNVSAWMDISAEL